MKIPPDAISLIKENLKVLENKNFEICINGIINVKHNIPRLALPLFGLYGIRIKKKQIIIKNKLLISKKTNKNGMCNLKIFTSMFAPNINIKIHKDKIFISAFMKCVNYCYSDKSVKMIIDFLSFIKNNLEQFIRFLELYEEHLSDPSVKLQMKHNDKCIDLCYEDYSGIIFITVYKLENRYKFEAFDKINKIHFIIEISVVQNNNK